MEGLYLEAVAWRCSVKKVFLEISQNSQENTSARVSEASSCNFIKKETKTQVFSCEFCEISKNIFFTEHLWWLLLCILQGKVELSSQNTFTIKVISKFIKVKNCGTYWICQSIDHGWSIKTSRWVCKSYFNQWIMENAG